jgi:hypothetical protein
MKKALFLALVERCFGRVRDEFAAADDPDPGAALSITSNHPGARPHPRGQRPR